jgi:hypothetical protein
MTFVKDGVLQTGTGSTVAIPSSGLLFPAIGEYVSTQVVNFGQDSSFGGEVTAQGNTDANGIGDFYYAPPAGYLALCTANLPEPAIDPAQDDVPADYFNVILWSGNNETAQSITGVGFQPDFVWSKVRNTADLAHRLIDAVRGPSKQLYSDLTNAEATDAQGMTSFDSDGFSVGTSTSLNYETRPFVGWCWKADGSGVTNTDGTITSTVSANQKAGFSIVSYTGTGATTNKSVGHGLSQTPDMLIYKNRNQAGGWDIYHSGVTSPNASWWQNYLQFDTDASTSYTPMAQPSSSLINFPEGNVVYNTTSEEHLWYAFHSVEGYSKFGSYIGNGSASNGPFIYTGFQPAFVILKNASASGRSWMMQNNKVNPYNVVASVLSPDLPDQEYTSTATGGYGVDFVSNGFKIVNDNVNWNASGATFIYMAFAEMPFKYSNAR